VLKGKNVSRYRSRFALLERIEANAPSTNSIEGDSILLPGYNQEQINYQLRLLQDDGLIVGKAQYYDDEPHWLVNRLTADGHNVLDTIRDEKKMRIAKTILSGAAVAIRNIPELVAVFMKANPNWPI